MTELLVKDNPKSYFTESIRNIKTNLRFSSVNIKVKTILITSSVAGEGKSFIASNLALEFASSFDKVLLIDCDLRKGRQDRLFFVDTKQGVGLSNLLIDDNWKENIDKYVCSTGNSNLDVLVTGSIPPNPTVLLESQKMEDIIKYLKESYDIVILDAPPVTGLSDSLILSKLVDAVLIVVRSRKTNMELLENTINALKNVGANVAGVILNRIKPVGNKYYKKY